MSQLSESKHPAYNLRPNKAIDRFIFLELLHTLELHHSLRQYSYIGLGGPFLEDFRLLSHQFSLKEMISVEKDGETSKRQSFHACSRNMKCVCSSLKDFVATQFPSDQPVIVWADYTDISRESLSEVADIARKSVPGSILRVTVRAESPVESRFGPFRKKGYPLRIPPSKEAEFESVRKFYSTDMSVDGIVFPTKWFQWSEFSKDRFPLMLSRMIMAVVEGACTKPKTFLPLHSVKYSDGTIMLSVTGLICQVSDYNLFLRHFRDNCMFSSGNVEEVDKIDVPSLTTKERLHLEGILPTTRINGDECVEKLGYLIEGDDSNKESREKLEQFEKYYRLYPYFGKIVP